MAIYHLAARTISRATGRTATAAAAYRSGDEIADERTGEVHDYRRRSGVADAFIVAPAGSPVWSQDRAALWNAAEAAERRKNSTVAREVVLALPAELDAAGRRAAAKEFAERLVRAHGFVADVAIHEPGREGDQRNHHAHVLLTTRRLEPAGFGAKTRELDVRPSGPEAIKRWRSEWAEVANAQLEIAGRAERIDHRSLAAQGIEREPTRHLGPAATAMERADERAASTRAAQVAEADAAATPADPQVVAARAEVVDLTARRDAVLAARKAEQARVAKVAEQRRAQQVAAREQAGERAAMARLSAAELRRVEQQHRPPPLWQMVEREADVQDARAATDGRRERLDAFDERIAINRRRVAEWREQHPTLARLHDSRIPYRNRYVASNEHAAATNTANRVGVAERLAEAQRSEREVRAAAEARLGPEHRQRSAIADRHGAEAEVRERDEAAAAAQQRDAARFAAASAKLSRMIDASDARDAGYTGPARFSATDQVWAYVDQWREAAPAGAVRARTLADLAAPQNAEARKMAADVARTIGPAREGPEQQRGRGPSRGEDRGMERD